MNTTDEIRVINQQIRKLRNERKTLWLSFVCDLFRQKQYGEWKNWNPKKIWVPSKDGLGLKKVFDMVNEIYGKDFYRYD